MLRTRRNEFERSLHQNNGHLRPDRPSRECPGRPADRPACLEQCWNRQTACCDGAEAGFRHDPQTTSERGSRSAPRFGTAFSPEISIPADLAKQNFTAVPIERYADRLSRCRNCRRPFVFYAQEQKHWYEDLGINVTVGCPARCPECRRSRRHLKRRFQRYSLLTSKGKLTDGELAILVGEAIILYEAGILENEQTLRRLKNLAAKRIPGDPATEQVAALIARIPVICGQRLGPAEIRVLRGIFRLIDDGAEVVTEEQAMSAAIPPNNLDLGTLPSYANAFARLRRRALFTGWVQDRHGTWGVRPTQKATEEFRRFSSKE